MPYDWNVVTKEFVLRSLKNDDGKAFQPSVNELSLLKKSISQKDMLRKYILPSEKMPLVLSVINHSPKNI